MDTPFPQQFTGPQFGVFLRLSLRLFGVLHGFCFPNATFRCFVKLGHRPCTGGFLRRYSQLIVHGDVGLQWRPHLRTANEFASVAQ